MTILPRLFIVICVPLGACRERPSPNSTINSTSVSSAAARADTAPPLSAERARVNGIGVDKSSAQVRATLGAPDSIPTPLRIAGPGDSATTWLYHMAKIYFIGDRVRGIVCQGQPCRTPDGVTIGDSLSRVQRMYGPAFALALPGTTYRRLIYPTAEGGNCTMEFEFNLGIVTKISLGCD